MRRSVPGAAPAVRSNRPTEEAPLLDTTDVHAMAGSGRRVAFRIVVASALHSVAGAAVASGKEFTLKVPIERGRRCPRVDVGGFRHPYAWGAAT